MLRSVPLLTLLPIAVLPSACPMALPVPGGPALAFDVRELRHGQWLEQPEFEVEEGVGSITVDAVLSTPDPCRRFDASAHRSTGELQLDVVIRPVGEACVAMVGTFEYTARIGDLPPGRYRLRVTHRFLRTGDPSPRIVLDREIEVS